MGRRRALWALIGGTGNSWRWKMRYSSWSGEEADAPTRNSILDERVSRPSWGGGMSPAQQP